jgi:hypothetical protein
MVARKSGDNGCREIRWHQRPRNRPNPRNCAGERRRLGYRSATAASKRAAAAGKSGGRAMEARKSVDERWTSGGGQEIGWGRAATKGAMGEKEAAMGI